MFIRYENERFMPIVERVIDVIEEGAVYQTKTFHSTPILRPSEVIVESDKLVDVLKDGDVIVAHYSDNLNNFDIFGVGEGDDGLSFFKITTGEKYDMIENEDTVFFIDPTGKLLETYEILVHTREALGINYYVVTRL